MLIIILLTLIAAKLHIFSPFLVILNCSDVLVGIVMLCTSTRELFRATCRKLDLSFSVRLLRPFLKTNKLQSKKTMKLVKYSIANTKTVVSLHP